MLKINKITDIDYKSAIDTLIENQDWFSSEYTNGSLNFSRQRYIDEICKVEDKSFLLLNDNKPIAAFIGSLLESEGLTNLNAYMVPCVLVESGKQLTKKERKYFLRELICSIGYVHGKLRYRDFLLNGKMSFISEYLLSEGGKPITVFLRTIDLHQDEASLKKDIRKSYHSLINWGLRELHPVVYTCKNISIDHILMFRDLHILVSGRETRSRNSWIKQYDSIKNGEAFIVFGYLGDELVSAGYFIISKTNCFYGVSASRRDLFDKPIFHSLMWTAMLHAKQIGCHWFDMGEQFFSCDVNGNHPTQKELGISKFKTGFGGCNRVCMDIELSIL